MIDIWEKDGELFELIVSEPQYFATIGDLIAVTNGELSPEEADRRWRESQMSGIAQKGTFTVAKIDRDKGVVTFDVEGE